VDLKLHLVLYYLALQLDPTESRQMKGTGAACLLCLPILQACVATPRLADGTDSDATALYQTAVVPNKIDKKSLDLARMNLDKQRHQSLEEIENTVRAIENYTELARLIPERATQATNALKEDGEGGTPQVVGQLVTAFESLARTADLHAAMLATAVDACRRNAPPGLQVVTSKGDEQLKGVSKELGKSIARAKLVLAKVHDDAGVCSNISYVLSEYRMRTKRYAKGCEVVLFMLPPPLPQMNPWMNATMVEALRNMYTTSRNAMRDVDDNLESSLTLFLKNSMNCDVDIVELPDAGDTVEKSAAVAQHRPCFTALAILLPVFLRPLFWASL